MGWARSGNADRVRMELESWVPRMFWVEFNEVFGCLGQMSEKKELQEPLREFLAREQFKSIEYRVGELITSYNRSKKRKKRKTDRYEDEDEEDNEDEEDWISG